MALEKCCLLCSDPALVGKAFVKQYYTQMHRDPSQMHRFYLDQSSFVHGGSEIGSEEPVIGQKVCGKREGREGERRGNWKERFWRGEDKGRRMRSGRVKEGGRGEWNEGKEKME